MDEETTRLVFIAIMTVGFLVWLWSLQKALALGRRVTPHDWRMLPEEQAKWSDTESGAKTVRGEPEELSKSLTHSLTQLSAGGFAALYEITEQTPNRIVLKKTGPLMCNQPVGMYFSEAEVTFENQGNNTTKVSYLLGFDRLLRRVKAVTLGIILGIGLPTLVIVGFIMWYYVLPSQIEAVRWQVMQTLQIAHALWPPFLFLGIYSIGRRQSKTYFSNLISTL